MKKILLMLMIASPLTAKAPQTNKEKLIKAAAIVVRDTAISAVIGGLSGLIMAGGTRRVGAAGAEGIPDTWANQNPIWFGMKWGAALGALIGLSDIANEFAS
jgi:hypothetical protein